jgi:hypothetical protein
MRITTVQPPALPSPYSTAFVRLITLGPVTGIWTFLVWGSQTDLSLYFLIGLAFGGTKPFHGTWDFDSSLLFYLKSFFVDKFLYPVVQDDGKSKSLSHISDLLRWKLSLPRQRAFVILGLRSGKSNHTRSKEVIREYQLISFKWLGKKSTNW